MPRIRAPADLNQSERRTFRELARTLAERGIDVEARLELIADYARATTRLTALRKHEAEAEPTRRLAAARAVNAAATEKRRLHDAVWRGARAPQAKQTLNEREAEIASEEGQEAWRRYFHHKDRTLTKQELKARYGSPGFRPLLYATAREEAADLIYFDRCRGRRSPPPSYHEEDDDYRAATC